MCSSTLPQEMEPQTYREAFKFFFMHTVREAKRNKLYFLLSFFSVYIVVLSILIISSIVTKGPIIFLKQNEGHLGQIDGTMVSSNLTGMSATGLNN
jgi:hypothetical protein